MTPSAKNDRKAIRSAVSNRVKAEREASPVKGEGPKIPSADLLTALESGERGDALLFCRLMKGRLAYDHGEARWNLWGGHHWQHDKLGEHFALCDELQALYAAEASDQHDKKLEADLDRRAGDSRSRESLVSRIGGRIRQLNTTKFRGAVLKFSSSGHESLAISGEEWDNRPELLACANGVINLETGDFRPGVPEDYLRTASPIAWDADAECPEWRRFLDSVFENAEVVDYLQRLLGYALYGRVQEHVLPILWGKGRNGKGVLIEMLSRVFGEYSYPLPSELLLDQARVKNADGPSPSIMAMRGKRLVWSSETDEGRRFSAAQVKWLSGDDTIVGRSPYAKDMIRFRPSHLFLLLTNHKPHANADDYAFWQRMALIEFPFQFVDAPAAPNERPVDKKLKDKLVPELPGILRWLVEGCLWWRRDGLMPPEAVSSATKRYQAGEDLVGQFITERCVTGPGWSIQAKDLYKAYERWSQDMGVPVRSQKKFGPILVEKGFEKDEGRVVTYLGIALKPEDDRDD